MLKNHSRLRELLRLRTAVTEPSHISCLLDHRSRVFPSTSVFDLHRSATDSQIELTAIVCHIKANISFVNYKGFFSLKYEAIASRIEKKRKILSQNW